MKTIITTAIAFTLATGAAYAHDHSSKAAAQAMRDTIQSLGNGSYPANAYTGGWGNIAGPAAANGKGQNNVGPKDD